jgi:hypothetical protein
MRNDWKEIYLICSSAIAFAPSCQVAILVTSFFARFTHHGSPHNHHHRHALGMEIHRNENKNRNTSNHLPSGQPTRRTVDIVSSFTS